MYHCELSKADSYGSQSSGDASPDDWEPYESAFDNSQWYITDMYEDFDGSAAHYEEVESTLVDGMIPLDLTHVFDVTFTK